LSEGGRRGKNRAKKCNRDRSSNDTAEGAGKPEKNKNFKGSRKGKKKMFQTEKKRMKAAEGNPQATHGADVLQKRTKTRKRKKLPTKKNKVSTWGRKNFHA